LDPGLLLPACAAVIALLSMPLLAYPAVRDRDLRLQGFDGNLTLIYLDALLGAIPVRAYDAARTIERQHDDLLASWSRASAGYHRASVAASVVQTALGTAMVVWIVLSHLGRPASDPGGALLLVYLALHLPALGEAVSSRLELLPRLRNAVHRQLEPLAGPEWVGEPAAPALGTGAPPPPAPRAAGVAIAMREVGVRIGASPILRDVTLSIPSGSHVAVVGQTGAGKSSLVRALLGLHPVSGAIWIDGQPLDPARTERLRQEAAWVDPATHLFNRSRLDNLCYGEGPEAARRASDAARAMDLQPVLD